MEELTHLIEGHEARMIGWVEALMVAAALAIALAIFALYLFVTFRRDVKIKLDKMAKVVDEAGEVLVLVREHALNARDSKADTKRALTDMKAESEKTQTIVVGAIEQSAVKAAAIVASSVAPTVGTSEANPLQVHLVDPAKV